MPLTSEGRHGNLHFYLCIGKHPWQGWSCCVLSIGVKQGCPLSPTLFGLFADGLHRYLQLCCPDDGFAFADGTLVPDLGHAETLCSWQLVLQVYSGS